MKEGSVISGFQIDRAVYSHYDYNQCALCGGEAFIAYNTDPYFSTYYCPRCGRYVIKDSLAYVSFKHNSECLGSAFFNYLLEFDNTRYYANGNKMPIIMDSNTKSSFDLSKNEIIYYDDLKKRTSDDIEVILKMITQNIGGCLREEGNSFFIDEGDVHFLCLLFYIEKNKDVMKKVMLRIDQLINDKKYLKIFQSENDKTYYTLTFEGWKVAKRQDKSTIGDDNMSKKDSSVTVIMGDNNVMTNITGSDNHVINNPIMSKDASSKSISDKPKNSLWKNIAEHILKNLAWIIVVIVIGAVLLAFPGIPQWILKLVGISQVPASNP